MASFKSNALHSTLFVAIAVLGIPLASAQPDESAARPIVSSVTQIPPSVHEAMQAREYELAVKTIEQELQKEDVQSADYLLYLKGIALTESDQRDEATKAFLELEKLHPASDWISRSRFGRAAIAVMNRQYNVAGEIYREEAERLLSRGRKDELAKIYLEFADRFFEGVPANDPSQAKQPDFKQALEYYREANKLGPTVARRQQIEFRIARCLEELDQFDEAITAYQDFLKQHGDDQPQSGEAATIDLRTDAHYRLGLCQLENKQPAAARRTWQDFLAKQDAKPIDNESLADRLANAKYRMAHTYGLPNPRTIGDLELAVSLTEQFLKTHADHELAPKAELEIAQGYEKHRRNVQAVARLESLIANPKYQDSQQLAVARRMLGQSYFAQQEFDKAITAWKAFLDKHPTDSQWPDVQQNIIGAEYAAAADALERKEYDEARTLWQTFLNKYPLDNRAPIILFQFGEMNFRAASARHAERVREAVKKGQSATEVQLSQDCRDWFEAAIADWQRLVAKYPDTAQASHASLRIGITLEEQLERRKEALEAYKKVTGQSEPAAKERIRRLTQPELQVMTKRKFRSDEDAHILLTTRNLEHVAIDVYTIDMTDYFRKMHLATGVEKLDIALIDPDEQFKHQVDAYEPFKRIEQEVKIPIDGPGVTAVTVSSDKMEATTMVVVSDLDVLVKSSRNELFLFAQNMRTGKPADGVSVLVSDGDSVFEELTTDGEGIARTTSGQLRDTKDLRVFAVSEGHVASTVTNLDGLDFAVGLTPTGYLFTDRPVYRPGELVNIKGIIRWVDQDRFTFKEGETFTLDVYDSRGRRLKTEKVSLGRFGTIHTNLMMPKSAVAGLCRVHLHRPRTPDQSAFSFDTQFEVKQFKIEPVQLSIETDKSVYLRGDDIVATIAMQYSYGAPLADQEIQYSIGNDGEVQTTKTGENGKAELKFPTRRFSEQQGLMIHVECPERNVRQSHVVYLATRGFSVNVNTTRDVFIVGETFDATVKVADPSGEPVGTKLKLELLEITNDTTGKRFGISGERLVDTFEVTTNADSGEAVQTIQFENGGTYIVRATATDQFDNAVSGQTSIHVSGDDDTTRLRILADRHNYKVGDEAAIRLHWRDAPALALITFDGASVLGHQLVDLKQGENVIRIPMEAHLAPNFFLSASVMQREKLHEAVSGFVVEKQLHVKLTPSTTELKPTESIKVGIEVTDSSGNPVAAELAIAMVQSNLLEQFPSRQQAITDAFTSGLRQRRIRQTSSCTFSYSTATRSINQALLVESERRAARFAEAAALADRFSDVGADFDDLADAITPDSGPFGATVPGADPFGAPAPIIPNTAYAGGVEMDEYRAEQLQRERQSTMGRQEAMMQSQQALPPTVDFQVPFDPGTMQVLNSAGFELQQDDALQARIQAPIPSFFGRGQFQQEKQNARDALANQAKQNWAWGASLQPNDPLLKRRDLTLNGLTADGKLMVVNGMNERQVMELVHTEGARIFAALVSGETGFWDPVVTTDEQGKAELEITMPAESTAWRIDARAVSAEAIVGAETAEVITRKTLFGQLTIPPAFTIGDKATINVEIHNSLDGARKIDVALTATMGDASLTQNKTIDVQDSGISQTSFPVEILQSEEVRFELTLTSDNDVRDTSEATAQVLPYGFPVYQTASGTAAQNTLALLKLDGNQKAKGQTLELMIGGNINQSLLDSMLGVETLIPLRCFPTSMLARSVSDCMGGVALLKSIRQSAQQDSPQAAQITEIVSGSISNLIAAQQDEGGWGMSGLSSGPADPILSARIMTALAIARRSGFGVPNNQFEQGIAFLKKAFAGETDLNRQSILLASLAESGGGDFALANRLYRERNRLDGYGLVQLMMALTSLNHNDMAAELIPLVKLDAARLPSEVGRTSIEIAALELIALQRMKIRPELRETLADRLLAGRAGARWPVETDNGAAITALAAHFGETPPRTEAVTLTIYVNGEELETVTLQPGAASRRLKVPAKLIDADQQRIEFELEGRGEFSYSAVLTGFADAGVIKSTTGDWTVQRRYEPDQIRLDGKLIPRGHSVINGGYSWTPNQLTELPVGKRGIVTLLPRVRYQDSRPIRTYLMLVEPIPAGCTVLEESISGRFDRYEITPGAITFYIGDSMTPGDIHYTIAGYVPGEYRTAPAVLRSYFSPSEIAVSDPGTIRVLNADQKSSDQYKLTPDELFALGKAYYAKDEFQKAFDHLIELQSNWQLDSEPFKESVSMLFRSAMKLGNHADTVKFFEIIKERFPDVELSFEEILKVAASYREIAEYERSYLVYRATVQGSFEKENQVAGFLNARGEFLRSVQAMESLLRDYPAESYLATASYALAQEVYRRAESVRDDAKLVEAGVTRVDLIDGSIRMLDDFVTNWPEDPSSDQASFALATALIDLEQYELAIERGEKYAQRYPSSRLLDSFWYIIGFCYFELQDHQKALEMCRKVAEASFQDPQTGSTRQADNKWEAIYIMGQVHHSLGQAAKAIDEYAKVSERFKDAAEAIEFFTRKAVSLPDVTTLLPEEKTVVQLQHRNLEEVFIKVYRIDLMKFGLTQRNLDRITAINLAGIKPYHQETIKLGDGKDYRDRETEVTLPLKEQGAYLVVCRGENLYASGLIVVSPLELAVEEDPVSGRVRVVVKDKNQDKFVGDVDVKVIGSSNDKFISGQTDLRGLFVADEIRGTSTVIAVSKDHQYAFHRGSTPLLDAPRQEEASQMMQNEAPFGEAAPSQAPAAKGGKPLLDNLFNTNRAFQSEQKLNIEGLMNNTREGIQTKEAY